MYTCEQAAALRSRMAVLRVSQADLAQQMGINATLLNHILNGRREPPSDFAERAEAALDLLAAAEKAAAEARERVLAGGAS